MFFWKRQSLHTSSFSLLIKRRPACCKFSRIYAGIFLCFEFFGLPKNDVAFLDRFEKIRVVSQWFLWEIRGREACMSRLHRPGSPFVKNIIRTNNRQAREWAFSIKLAFENSGSKMQSRNSMSFRKCTQWPDSLNYSLLLQIPRHCCLVKIWFPFLNFLLCC